MEGDLSEVQEDLIKRIIASNLKSKEWFEKLENDMKDLFVRHSYLAMTQGRILKKIEGMNERVNNIESSIGMFYLQLSNVLYISFDRFLLAVESRDLSQTDKNIENILSFPSFNL